MAHRKEQISTVVVETIKERIAVGDWQTGDRLPSIAQLAQQLQVGVGSVREAVKELAALGLLRIEHGRGMFVSATQSAPRNLAPYFQNEMTGSILELCETRRILEPDLAALAAERGTDAELQSIREQALAMSQLASARLDFSKPDLEFHHQIAVASHNSLLAILMESVIGLFLKSSHLTSQQPGMTARAVRYHLLIADALCDRNAIQARLLMLAHVNDAINGVLSRYATESGTDVASELSPAFLWQRSLTRSDEEYK